MSGTQWDKASLVSLVRRIYKDRLDDFAGFATKEELYCSVEAMGSSPDPDIRGYVQDILYWLDRERAFSFLVRCLDDPDGANRRDAVELLGGYGERITPFLIPVLQSDPFVDARCCAAGMLGFFGTQDALAALQHAAEYDHNEDCHLNSVSVIAKDAIEQIKARYTEGGDPDLDVVPLADEQRVKGERKGTRRDPSDGSA